MRNDAIFSEPTVQQEEMPQVPPLKFGAGDISELPFDVELLNKENFFLTSLDPHCGQIVSLSEEPIFCNKEKVFLHFSHVYS
jgi:hypothetical protein